MSALSILFLLTFTASGVVPCPAPAPVVIENADGTYSRTGHTTVTSVTCYRDERWEELWTGYPNRGGGFVRRVAPGECRRAAPFWVCGEEWALRDGVPDP